MAGNPIEQTQGTAILARQWWLVEEREIGGSPEADRTPRWLVRAHDEQGAFSEADHRRRVEHSGDGFEAVPGELTELVPGYLWEAAAPHSLVQVRNTGLVWECDGCKMTGTEEAVAAHVEGMRAGVHPLSKTGHPCTGAMLIGSRAWRDFHDRGIHPLSNITLGALPEGPEPGPMFAPGDPRYDLWRTILQSQAIHRDWSAEDHIGYLEQEGSGLAPLGDFPVYLVSQWLRDNIDSGRVARLLAKAARDGSA